MIVDDFSGERVETEEQTLDTLLYLREEYFRYVVIPGPARVFYGKAEYDHSMEALEDIEDQIGWIISQIA